MKSVSITILPSNKNLSVTRGSILAEALRSANVHLRLSCGGKGVCGKCKIRLAEGEHKPTPEERNAFSASELEQGWRLACRLPVNGPIKVEVPRESVVSEMRVVTEGNSQKGKLDPAVRKRLLRLPKPDLADSRCDLDRLFDSMEQEIHPELSIDTLRSLPGLLRAGDFEATAVSIGRRIFLEEGDTTTSAFGVAVDIGTTTVAAFLVDLCTGETMDQAARTNPQREFGDDVISRIEKAQSDEGLMELQSSIVHCINDAVSDLCRRNGIPVQSVYEITIAGNTAMEHLFAGISPSAMGYSPYVSVFRSGLDLRSRELGLTLHPEANVHCLPNIAGFVGGDIVAGVLATQLHRSKEVCLLVDIGTNGEMVLGCSDFMVACSTAAGPAFEGARIRHGVRAEPGAVERVVIDQDIVVQTIDKAPPTGICGSGLIDLISELLKAGIIDETGRILEPAEIGKQVPSALVQRLVEEDGNWNFLFATTAAGSPLRLMASDVRQFQLAKAAIRSGIEILMREGGMTLDQVRHVYLAGAFGSYIQTSAAIRAGLIPNFDPDRIRAVGNSAGAGARLALLSASLRQEAASISKKARYVELAGRPDFQDEFANALLFPC